MLFGSRLIRAEGGLMKTLDGRILGLTLLMISQATFYLITTMHTETATCLDASRSRRETLVIFSVQVYAPTRIGGSSMCIRVS